MEHQLLTVQKLAGLVLLTQANERFSMSRRRSTASGMTAGETWWRFFAFSPINIPRVYPDDRLRIQDPHRVFVHPGVRSTSLRRRPRPSIDRRPTDADDLGNLAHGEELLDRR
jgi:hypothetical protein